MTESFERTTRAVNALYKYPAYLSFSLEKLHNSKASYKLNPYVTGHQGQLSLAIPQWLGDSLCHVAQQL